jgi:hypothetical protein
MELGLFRSYVFLGSGNGFHDDFLSAETEVSQFDERQRFSDEEFGLEEDILRFQIAMGDAVVVQFLDSLADLQDALQSFFFVHFVVFAEV